MSILLLDYLDQFLLRTAASNKIKYTEFPDGIIICADSTAPETFDFVKKWLDGEKVACFLFDPPYLNVLSKTETGTGSKNWDKTKMNQQESVDWMFSWTKLWWPLLINNGAYWCWGGTGTYKFHPFFLYITQAEGRDDIDMYLADYVSWAKTRAYGSAKRMLYLREECAYFLKGTENTPRVFNVPYLEEKRPYSGFNAKYPALSEYYRRGNIWKDIRELFSGKYHSCQKPIRLMEVPIEISTKKGEIILDAWAGAGTTGFAARNLGRRFILIEKDPTNYKNIVSRMKNFKPGDKLK